MGEREGEKHQYLVASHVPLPHHLWTWPTTQAFALIGNRTSNPLVYRPALNPVNHTSQSFPGSLNGLLEQGYVQLLNFLIVEYLS